MNKGQLVTAIAVELGTTRAEAQRALNAVLDGFKQGLRHDGQVTVAGFGGFARKLRKARTVRNPATGEPIEVPAQMTVSFKPAQALKEEMAHAEPVARA